jgi:hypothetical protein
VTRNAGVGICASCQQHKQRVQVVVEVPETDGNHALSRGVSVCLDCARKPGVSFECDVEPKRPAARVAARRIAKKSQRAESRAAEDIGGRKTKASGATNQDGDAVTPHFMVEQKMSGAKSLIVSEKTILKAASQAARRSRDWVLRLKLTELDMDLAVMKWPTASTLIKQWEEAE